MDDPEEFLSTHLQPVDVQPPFTSRQVIARYHLAVMRRQGQRRARMVISGIALAAALLAFLFLNMNGEIGPGFLDPTRVWAATPISTLISTPFP